MPQLTAEQKQKFKRLLIRTRKVTSDLESIHSITTLGEYRSTMEGIHLQLREIIAFFPDYQQEFFFIPSDLSHKNPSTFPGTIKLYRSLLDTIEDELNQNETASFNEFFINEGQAFTASRLISDILSKSQASIKIVDNYLAPYSVEILEQANTNREIKILTKTPTKEFISAIKVAQNGRPNKIQVRESSHFHDRYLIIDDTEVWICGPSLNFLGFKKPGVLVELQDSSAKESLLQEFDQIWSSSKVVA